MMKKIFHSYISNSSGNIAIIFSLVALPMVVLIGGGIDMQRVAQSKVKLQSAVEAGALAAASFKNKGQSTEEFVKEYVRANVADAGYMKNLKVNIVQEDVNNNRREITVSSTSDIESSFLQLIGIPVNTIEVSSTAFESRGNLEYSLVLDVSFSMRGQRLKNLKTAAGSFVDLVLDGKRAQTTSVNLVPFGGTVNIGTLFDEYVVAKSDPGTITDPNKSDYSKNLQIPDHKFRFSHGEDCVELRKEDYDLDDIPSKSRAQVPHFWKYSFFNPWCPYSTSAAVWNSNEADVLKDRIEEFTLSDGTGMNYGALWGAKALSPSLRGKLGGNFSDRPSNFDDDNTQKIIVIMTDGGITSQLRPARYDAYSVHTNKTKGMKTFQNLRGGAPSINKKNEQMLLTAGRETDASTSASAIGNFKKTCEDLKSQGVHIYTVGFQIAKDSKQEVLLQYCASNPANYYLVKSLDISEAFKSIISSVNKLRVSG